MPGPVLSGLAIIARYAAQKGIPAAIKKYGKTQVSKAVKNKSGLSRAAESSLRELGVSGKGIRAVRKRADAKQAKAATPAKREQGRRLRKNQEAVSQAKGAVKGAIGVGAAAYAAGKAKGAKERARLRKEVTEKRKKEKGFPFKTKGRR